MSIPSNYYCKLATILLIPFLPFLGPLTDEQFKAMMKHYRNVSKSIKKKSTKSKSSCRKSFLEYNDIFNDSDINVYARLNQYKVMQFCNNKS